MGQREQLQSCCKTLSGSSVSWWCQMFAEFWVFLEPKWGREKNGECKCHDSLKVWEMLCPEFRWVGPFAWIHATLFLLDLFCSPTKAQRVILAISILSATVLPSGCHCLWISASRLTVPFDLGLPFPILEGFPLCIGAWLEKHTNCAGVGQALNF